MIFNDINGNNKNGNSKHSNSKHSNNDFDKIIMLIIEQQIMMILLTMVDNYSPKWRIVVDIYPTAKQQGKYLPLSPTQCCIYTNDSNPLLTPLVIITITLKF